MVDCSHANSHKNPALQPAVAQNVSEQIAQGNQSIIGLMLESHLEAGNQTIPADLIGAPLWRIGNRWVY